jgi:hypothetical protein
MIRQILKDTKGKFARVRYTNAAGETKEYTVRTGVKKHLAVSGEIRRPTPAHLVRMYSVTRGNTGYKSFDLSRIRMIRCGKVQVHSE